MKRFKPILLSTLLMCLTILTGCQQKPTKTMQIGCTILPIHTFIQELVSNDIPVYCFQTQQTTFEETDLTTEQKAALSKLEVYFTIGLPIERQLILPFLQENTDVKIVDLSKEADLSISESIYTWLSPENGIKLFATIQNTLTQYYPENAAAINENSIDYSNELEKLHTYVKVKFSSALERSIYQESSILDSYCQTYDLIFPAKGLSLDKQLAYQDDHMINEVYISDFTIDQDFVVETVSTPLTIISFNPFNKEYIQNIKSLTDMIYSHLMD